MRLLPCGDSSLLVELRDLEEVIALHGALLDDPPEGLVDVVPADRTLLLRADPTVTDLEALRRDVSGRTLVRGARQRGGRVEVEVRYDGEDLAEVGRLTGLGEQGVVRAHTGQDWTVAFCGFTPGFGYLVGADERLHVPRRDNPRKRVPAGAVALAGGFAGVYPRESPGGWQLIGHTDLRPWDIDRDPPAILLPGATVRFVAV
jgi:KipI family sensor histidine kinase inhibitor